jgi:DNA-binding CsgD family transcriptional regulator/tetratricopeptide (TPR) repeat protein
MGELLRRLFYFWWLQGHVAEARRWAEEMLSAAAPLPPQARASALFVAGSGAIEQGEFVRAATLLQEALDAYRTQSDHWGMAHCLILRGFISPVVETVEAGVGHFEEAQAHFDEIADVRGVGFTYTGLSALAVLSGDLDTAQRFGELRLALSQRLGDRQGISQALDDLGMAFLLQGRDREAADALREGLPHCLALGHLEMAAYALMGLAAVAVRDHELVRAARLFGGAEALREAVGVAMWPVRLNHYDAALVSLRNELEAARLDAAWAEGKGWSLQEVVHFALQSEPAADSSVSVAADSAPGPLSVRERQIATMIGRGLTSAEIAEALVLSERTVDSHADHIRRKLSLRSRTEIAIWAVAHLGPLTSL